MSNQNKRKKGAHSSMVSDEKRSLLEFWQEQFERSQKEAETIAALQEIHQKQTSPLKLEYKSAIRTFSGKDVSIDKKNMEILKQGCSMCVKYYATHKKALTKEDSETNTKTKAKNSANTKNKSKTTKKKSSSRQTTKIDIKKLKEFLLLNQKRKVTRSEVTEFCGVSSYSFVKRQLEKLKNSKKFFDIIVDLRKDKAPIGEIKFPKSCDNVEIASSKQDEEKKAKPESVTQEISDDVETQNIEDTTVEKNDSLKAAMIPETVVKVQSIENPENTTSQNITDETDCDMNIPPKRLTEILCIKPKTKYFLFDETIFQLPLNDYLAVLKEILYGNEKPVFCFFENQSLILDGMKKTSKTAADILKFIGQDNGNFIKLIPGKLPRPEMLGKYCKKYDIVMVSGYARNVAWCKVHGAKVIVPNYYRNLYPNPFRGTEIIGVDSNVLGYKYLSEIFKTAKTVYIPDIQLKERHISNSVFSNILAYYGKFGIAEVIGNNTDRNLVNFFKTHGVSKVYTADFGFSVFAKFAHLPFEYIYEGREFAQKSSNTMEIIKSRTGLSGGENSELSEGTIIKIDTFTEKFNGTLKVFNDNEKVSITVFNSTKQKKTSLLRFIEVEKKDIIVIKKDKIIIIAEVINTADATAKIWYYGVKENIPRNFLKFLN